MGCTLLRVGPALVLFLLFFPLGLQVLAMLAHLEETVQGEGSRGRERGRDREPLLDRQHSGGFHQLWKKTFGKK